MTRRLSGWLLMASVAGCGVAFDGAEGTGGASATGGTGASGGTGATGGSPASGGGATTSSAGGSGTGGSGGLGGSGAGGAGGSGNGGQGGFPEPTTCNTSFYSDFNSLAPWMLVPGDGLIEVVGGDLEMTSGSATARAQSVDLFPLTACGISAQAEEVENVAGTLIAFALEQQGAPGNRLEMVLEGPTLTAQTVANGVESVAYQAPFDAAQHVFWRIRKLGPTLRWVTSPDANVWTDFHVGSAPAFVGETNWRIVLRVTNQGSVAHAHYDKVSVRVDF